jgi:hypothetical protein
MNIKATLTEGMLGTASANPDVHSEFIASKSADADKVKEELESLPADDLIEKSMTVFPRTKDGAPMLYDYQLKGFLKETLGILLDFSESDCKIGKAKLSRWTFKKIVDNAVMVSPRQIVLDMPEGGAITHCVRPLRAETMRGERVALATSEEIPAGTTFECEITTLDKHLDELMVKCLNCGANKGIGQWRNSGKGRFTWVEIA